MATTSRITVHVKNDENASAPAGGGSPASTRSAATSAAVSLSTVGDSKTATTVQNQAASKRALGDITNALRASASNAVSNHTNKAHLVGPKIRRTAAASTKQPAGARRVKPSVLAAVAAVSSAASSAASGRTLKTASPMATSATAPRRVSDRLAKRAAAAAAAAVQCRLNFVASMEENTKAGDPEDSEDSNGLPPGVTDIDKDDKSCLAVAQFAPLIHQQFVKKELDFMADPTYMSKQQDITLKMRAILIDWLVDVHCKFRLRPETLFLTVNVIDRYLAQAPVIRRKLQLVGVTAMLIASKYEEIYAPEIADFVYISDKAYNRKEIIDMEAVILNEVQFTVTMPYSLTFMRRVLKAVAVSTGISSELHANLAHYLIELALPSANMLHFRPSVLGAAAVLLAGKIIRESFQWNETMCHYSGKWSESDLGPCMAQLRLLLDHEVDAEGSNKLTAVKRKFSSSKFCNVSTTVITMAGCLTSDMEICNVVE